MKPPWDGIKEFHLMKVPLICNLVKTVPNLWKKFTEHVLNTLCFSQITPLKGV